jgi:hypothetical protein
MYIISYYLNCRQTYIAEIHLCFQGHDPLSPVVVHVTVDKCILHGIWSTLINIKLLLSIYPKDKTKLYIG